jgi:hypothetical protein
MKMITRVEPLIANSGKPMNNHFMIVETTENGISRTLQSYKVLVCRKDELGTVDVDKLWYDYSRTTVKAICLFLGITSKELHKFVKDGIFGKVDLNNV